VARPGFPYRWHWRNRPVGRKGQRLRVIVRGRMNSALVEFEDGHRAVVSRSGLRRAGDFCEIDNGRRQAP
jgi:hypothetical protein